MLLVSEVSPAGVMAVVWPAALYARGRHLHFDRPTSRLSYHLLSAPPGSYLHRAQKPRKRPVAAVAARQNISHITRTH